MTLIVGFWCDGAAVLCADSQETRGGLKNEVDKLPIQPGHDNGTDIVCGCAGHGELADAFRVRLMTALSRSTTCGESAIKNEIEAELVEFHRSKVFRAFPGRADDKLIAGLIAVRTVAKEVFLFKFLASTVQPVQSYALAGEEYSFFERLLQRRYRGGLSIHQAVLIGVEVVNEAKQSSVYVGGPTRVVTATPNEGLQTLDYQGIAWTEAHINTQNQLFDDLRFNLASTSAQAQEQLMTFGNSITSMRGVYGSKFPAWPTFTIPIKDSDDE